MHLIIKKKKKKKCICDYIFGLKWSNMDILWSLQLAFGYGSYYWRECLWGCVHMKVCFPTFSFLFFFFSFCLMVAIDLELLFVTISVGMVICHLFFLFLIFSWGVSSQSLVVVKEGPSISHLYTSWKQPFSLCFPPWNMADRNPTTEIGNKA